MLSASHAKPDFVLLFDVATTSLDVGGNPGGLALRFAGVVRYRDDKGPADADTIDTVRALY